MARGTIQAVREPIQKDWPQAELDKQVALNLQKHKLELGLG